MTRINKIIIVKTGRKIRGAGQMYAIGQIVRMKKKHPCGGDTWQIIRVGMDFRIKCLKCGHSVLLPRRRFERRVKEILQDSGADDQR